MAALMGIVEQIVYIKCFTNNLAGMFFAIPHGWNTRIWNSITG